MISYQDFEKVEMRVGKIIEVNDFPEARNPSYRLQIDLGPEYGIKKSSAQVTNYSKEELLGRQVICVTNFPPKQIGPAISEVLVLGVPSGVPKQIRLLTPDDQVPLGGKVY